MLLPPVGFDSTQMVIEEVDDRKRRENHLLILNVPEQIKSDNGKLRKDYDLNMVKSTLQKINNLQTKLSINKLRRLGAFDKDKTRLIRVRFDCRQDVTNIITHWRLIPKDNIVSYDITKSQRSQYNKLRIDVKKFNSSEENKNKAKQIVKFVNGNPKIFSYDPKKGKKSNPHDESVYEPSEESIVSKNVKSQRATK